MRKLWSNFNDDDKTGDTGDTGDTLVIYSAIITINNE